MYKTLLLLGLGVLISCKPEVETVSVLAQAYGKKLHLEDLADKVNMARTKKDSVQTISREVDNWVMTEMLYKVAKDELNDDIQLDELVDDYKKSLYIHELQKEVLANQLDTVVSENEVVAFLEDNKEAFALQEDIVKLLFIKVKEKYGNETLETLWKTENIPALKTIVKRARGLSRLNHDEWYSTSSISSLMPTTLQNQIQYKKPSQHTLKENGDVYFIKVLEYTRAGEIAPMAFVRNKIRQRIIINRSKVFLTNWKRELYYNNIQNKEIHIYNE